MVASIVRVAENVKRKCRKTVTIAEEKSITKASVRLFVAQPALSQCVQKVEKELGTPVSVRTTAGVTLTAEGQCFMDFVRKTPQEQKNFEKRVKALKNAERGEIYLGFTGTQATFVLPYFLPQFKERYPSIEIILVEALKLSGMTVEQLCSMPFTLLILDTDVTYIGHVQAVVRMTVSAYEDFCESYDKENYPLNKDYLIAGEGNGRYRSPEAVLLNRIDDMNFVMLKAFRGMI